MKVHIKKLTETAKIPTRGSDGAAGYDLYADIQKAVAIWPHETVMVQTGIAMEIPEGYFGAIFARSGIATRKGLRPANCVGVIDHDYRGEIIVALHNDKTISNMGIKVLPGERIAQLVLIPFMAMDFVEVSDLSETDRGDGGFGSTGNV